MARPSKIPEARRLVRAARRRLALNSQEPRRFSPTLGQLGGSSPDPLTQEALKAAEERGIGRRTLESALSEERKRRAAQGTLRGHGNPHRPRWSLGRCTNLQAPRTLPCPGTEGLRGAPGATASLRRWRCP